MKNSDVYQKITDFVVNQIKEQNVLPWQKTWSEANPFEVPTNYFTMKPYHGGNVFFLSFMPFARPYYMSYKQAQQLGGNVIKGSKATPVIYWNFLYKHEPTGKVFSQKEYANHADRSKNVWKKIPLLKYYNVFNIEQIEGIEYTKLPKVDTTKLNENEKIEACELTIKNMPKAPKILNGGDRAFYRPSTDTVTVPVIGQFNSSNEYYGTLFHELIHATGHESRLNRKGVATKDAHNKTKSDYGKEELIAEFGASFLNAIHGIETTVDNSVAYLNGWLEAIKGEPRLLIDASIQATKATNYILNEK